jgi:hypothetical protein
MATLPFFRGLLVNFSIVLSHGNCV